MWASNVNSAFVSGVRDSETALQSIGQYIEDYIDLVENVPNEIVRSLTQLHERNHVYDKMMNKLERALAKLISSQQTSDVTPQNGQDVTEKNTEAKKNRYDSIQKYLVAIQSISDEKLYLVQSIYEQLEIKARQLEHDLRTIAAGSGSNTLISPMKSPRDSTRKYYPCNDRHSHMNGNGNSGRTSASDSSPEINSSEENGSQDATSDNNGNETARLKNGSISNHIDEDIDENDPDTDSPIKGRRRKTKNPRGSDDVQGSDNNTGRGGRGGKRGFGGRSKDPHNNSVPSQQHNTSSTHHTSKRSKKKDSPNFLEDADPDEPLYCLCNQISFGEMIGCDNNNCQIEWFHFSCVQLQTKPKGKWYCPACRGDRSNVQRK